MTKTKRIVFWLIMLAMENICLLLIIIGTVWYLGVTIERRKTDFQRRLEILGMQSADFRARAPYVMFHPRPSRIAWMYHLSPSLPEFPGYSTYKDFLGFCEKLSREGNSNEPSPSRRIWELLSAEGRKAAETALASKDDSKAIQRTVSDYVNHVIDNPNLYTESDFRSTKLCEDAISLLALPRERLFDYELARLNRHLFTAAYPRTLRRAHAINSLGFLSPELPRKKGPDEFRVAMVGGSVVFCAYAPDDEWTPVGQLAKAMKERVPALKDKRVTYINAGMPSAVSGQELAQFIYHVLPLDIDLLVVFDGFNDFYCPLNGYDMRPGYPADYIVEEYRFYKYVGEKTWSSTFLSLFDPTLMRAKPEKVMADYYQALQIRKLTFDQIKPKILEEYMSNVHKMAKIANGFDIKAAVFLQPFSPKHNPVERRECRDLRQLYVWAGERYKAEAQNNTPNRFFHDLSYMGEELRDLFRDVAHYKHDPGNAIVANHMLDVMLAEGMFAE